MDTPLSQQFAQAQGIQANLAALPAPTIAAPDLSGGGGLPALSAPLLPGVQQSQVLTDQDKLNTLRNSGSGISQIHNPFLRGLAETGDVVGSILAPRIAQTIPGTNLHHNLLVNQAQQNLANDQAVQEKNAQIQNLDLQPQLKQQSAELNQSKLDEKTQHDEATVDAKQAQLEQQRLLELARNGQMEVKGPDGQTHIVDDPNSQVYKGRQVLADYHQAQIGLDQARAELAQAGNDPKSPAYQLALRKLQVSQQNAAAAGERAQAYMGHYLQGAYGVGMNGQVLPGTMELPDGTPVGSTNAANVRPTGTQRDAAGRAETMQELGDRLSTQLNDPEIQKYLGPVGGRLAEQQAKLGTLPQNVAQFYNDLKSYGAFQAGMHPVRGIGALNYFDEVMGGLHQTPEQLRGKLASNAATGASVQRVGTPKVAGGNNTHDPLGVR